MEIIKNFNPILWIFASYLLGAMATSFIKSLKILSSFENHHYIEDKLTKKLGVLKLGWLIRHSFMGKINPNIKFKGKLNKERLEQLKHEMTLAETGHLIAFLFLQILIVTFLVLGVPFWQIIVYTILNIVFNLYLVFLQQFNKRRIDRLLKLKY